MSNNSSLKIILLQFLLAITSREAGGKVPVCGKYNTLITKAEQQIIKADYKGALITYETAFKQRKNAVDCLNAGYCGLYLKDYNIALKYLRTYFIKGGRNFLTQQKLKDYKIEIPESLYDSLMTLNNMPVPPYAYRLVLDSLFTVDQHYHLTHNVDSLHYYDGLNYKFLMSYIKTHGFPEEKEMVLDSDYPHRPAAFILFTHFFQAGIMSGKDMDMLIKATCNDKLSPYQLAEFLFLFRQDERVLGIGSIFATKYKSVNYTDKWKHKEWDIWQKPLNAAQIATIDKERMDYGMEAYSLYIERVKFMLSGTTPFLLHIPSLEVYIFPKPEDAKKMCADCVLLPMNK